MSILEYVEFKRKIVDDLAAALQPLTENELLYDIIVGRGPSYNFFQV